MGDSGSSFHTVITMGGLAFSSGAEPLRTPRMPPNVYQHVKGECIRILLTIYDTVESPIDGPGKANFGDVDILLHGPKTTAIGKNEALEKIKTVLGAARLIIERGDGISGHCALPWPSQFSQETPKDGDNSVGACYIQVDVKVCSRIQELEWIAFKHAHGDLWNIIGSIIRPYGLTVDQSSLWLRIREVEKLNRNRAKIFLTSDKSVILEFLGLSEDAFNRGPFDSETDFFEYTTSCRMFWVRPEEPPSDPVLNEQTQETGASENPGKLKSNDRRRMKQRHVFARWQNEFISECREKGRFLTQQTTREKVTEEAMEKFGVREEFETRRDDFLRSRHEQNIFKDIIKPAIPPADPDIAASIVYRSNLVKALKRIIIDGEDRFGITPGEKLKDDNGFLITENVVDFINRKKDEVGAIAWEINKEKYEAKKARKLKLKAAEASQTSGSE